LSLGLSLKLQHTSMYMQSFDLLANYGQETGRALTLQVNEEFRTVGRHCSSMQHSNPPA
jgi:hypothetical protein